MRQKKLCPKTCISAESLLLDKVMEFWHSGTELQRLQNIKKLRVGNSPNSFKYY